MEHPVDQVGSVQSQGESGVQSIEDGDRQQILVQRALLLHSAKHACVNYAHRKS
jgi:hypothetical protein